MRNNKANLESFFILLYVSLFSLIVLTCSNPFLFEPNRDGGFFTYAAKEILKGKDLYLDIWDSKGPGIFMINLLGLWLGNGSRWGIWLLEFLFLAGSSLLGTTVMKRRWGVLPALFGISIGLMGLKALFRGGNTIEEYSLFFTWIAIFVFSQTIAAPPKWYFPFILGMMLGFNFWLRANNIGTTALLSGIWLIFLIKPFGWVQAFKKAFWLIAGFLIVIIPVLIYFTLQGSLGEMITASLLYNIGYSNLAKASAVDFPVINRSLMPGIIALGKWAYIPLLGFFAALLQFIHQIIHRQWNAFDLALVLIWPVEILASSVSGRAYEHYFICWIPILALLSGFLIYRASKFILPPQWDTLINKRFSIVFPLLGLAGLLFNFQYEISMNWLAVDRILVNHSEIIEYKSPLAEYIDQNTKPNDLVLIWGGNSGINLMANRSATDAPLFFPMITNSTIGFNLQERYFEQLIAQRPALIIDGFNKSPNELPSIDPKIRAQQVLNYPLANNTLAVLEYIAQNYTLETIIEDYGVYRLKNLATP